MAIVMIMMLRIMVIMILIIAKVMIMKSMIIKMIMVFTMMITNSLNTECSNYYTYKRVGSLNLTAILRQVFCLGEKDCYKYW